MDKKLNDPTLEVKSATRSLDKPSLISEVFGKEKVNFTFGVNGKLDVSLFNAESDEDPSEVFGKDTALIPFRKSRAWLKYVADRMEIDKS